MIIRDEHTAAVRHLSLPCRALRRFEYAVTQHTT
jgi:hypothetical protein